MTGALLSLLCSLAFIKSMTVRDHQTCGPPSFTAFLCITLLQAAHFLLDALQPTTKSKLFGPLMVQSSGKLSLLSPLSPLGSLHRVSLPRPCLTWAKKVQNTTSDSLTWTALIPHWVADHKQKWWHYILQRLCPDKG